jgi:hypothetical protein
MTFLPEKFSGSDEWSGVLEFPSDNVGPLIELKWEISVALDPVGVGWIHDGLTGGSDGDGFSEVGFSGLGDPGDFRRESLDMVLLDFKFSF